MRQISRLIVRTLTFFAAAALVVELFGGFSRLAIAQDKPAKESAKPAEKKQAETGKLAGQKGDEKAGKADDKDKKTDKFGDAAKAAKTFDDADHGVSGEEPANWHAAPANGVSVPGKALKVWTPDNVASIVLFLQEPGVPVTPRELLDSSVQGIEGMGIKVNEKEVRDIAKMRAMWLICTGKGTGGALGPNLGVTPTSQVWVAIPREKDVVVVLLTAPEKGLTEHRKLFDTLLKSLKITGTQNDAQKNSK